MKFLQTAETAEWRIFIRNNDITMKHKFLIIICLALTIPLFRSCSEAEKEPFSPVFMENSRPYTRWWWFASRFSDEDIRRQLLWLKEKGFGGVEVAFIYPVNRDPQAERFEFLGAEWQDKIEYAKHCADSLGLGCDFTFGTLWPFGGAFVQDEDRTGIFGDTSFRQPLRLSWTHPNTGNVLDHLDSNAFNRYAEVMGNALKPGLKGRPSALFCDSWEVETRKIWTDGFEEAFRERFGYDIVPFMDSIYHPGRSGERYDYMKLVSEYVLHQFYIPFTNTCHKLGAWSRVQCAGSPIDLISAYASVDIPESEAMLYEPRFSRIVASAAALSGKRLVSAESFTCLYGWPAEKMFEEKIMDLKLVADALFANGVNFIIWHGTPLNPAGMDTVSFYASVHIGRKGSLSNHLSSFNSYLAGISSAMRQGEVFSDVAVYLPLEDARIAGEYPPGLRMPWSWGAYELRYIEFPDELDGYNPLWINKEFLEGSGVENGRLVCNDLSFGSLYIDVEYLDIRSLEAIHELATGGLPVCLKRVPEQPGKMKDPSYQELLAYLMELPNVHDGFKAAHKDPPLFSGERIPAFFSRKKDDRIIVFMANPLTEKVTYPVEYGLSDSAISYRIPVTLNWSGYRLDTLLNFDPNQSLILELTGSGDMEMRRIDYTPGS